MNKVKNVVTLINDNDEAQIVGGKEVFCFRTKRRLHFKHPRHINPKLILVKHQTLLGNNTVESALEN